MLEVRHFKTLNTNEKYNQASLTFFIFKIFYADNKPTYKKKQGQTDCAK